MVEQQLAAVDLPQPVGVIVTAPATRWPQEPAPDDPRATAERPGMPQAGPYPRMPGGGISRRPLHFIILADCSGGMKGEKIQALNFAIADMLPHLAAWERDRNEMECQIDWQFTTADARIKLKRLYPVINPVNSGRSDH